MLKCVVTLELLGWSLLVEVFSVPADADCLDGVQGSGYLTDELAEHRKDEHVYNLHILPVLRVYIGAVGAGGCGGGR